MRAFFENIWVVGIGTGIISSSIVFIITNAYYRYRSKSKHLEQIKSANIDIIHTLRPYVAEKGLPEKGIVNAIISSAVRRYNVKIEELYSIDMICEELIYEIIGNVYVSSDQKQEYSVRLIDYLHKLSEAPSDTEQANHRLPHDVKEERDQDTKIAIILSVCMGISAGLVAGIRTFVSSEASPEVNEKLIDTMRFSLTIPVIPSAIIIAGLLIAVNFIYFLKKKK